MNILDIILLICFVPAIFQGIKKGLIAQAISIFSIIAGIWASSRFANIVSEFIAEYITASEQVLKVAAFAIILIAVFAALSAIGKMLEGVFEMVMLGWLNRLLGVVFALLKTAIIVGILIMAFSSLNDTFDFVKPEVLESSVLYPPLKEIAFEVFPYIKDMLTLK